LLQHFIDRFWEELALALEQGPTLGRSQDLLCAAIERVKRTYVSQISSEGIGGLIDELDQLINQDGKRQRGGSLEPPPSPSRMTELSPD
jgi:hypothetical protein